MCMCAAGALAAWQQEVERLQRAVQAAESQRRAAEDRAAEAETQLHAARTAHSTLDRQLRTHPDLSTPHTPRHIHSLRAQVCSPLAPY